MPNNILTTLADNPALIEAVKEVFARQFALPKDLAPMSDDALLGQKLRAYTTGTKAIEDAFKEIAQYKSIPDKPKRINEAR